MEDWNGLVFRATVRSGADGFYSISVPPGDYAVWASIPGLGALWRSRDGLVESISEADTVRIPQEPTQVEVSFLLGSARVRIQTPPALEGLTLWALIRNRDFYIGEALDSSMVSGGEVAFQFPAVPPGSYNVLVGLPGGERFYLPATHDFGQAESFIVRPLRTTLYETVLPRPCRLRGRIRGEILQWGQGIRVFLGTSESSEVSSGTASADGTFELQAYAPIRVCLGLEIEGRRLWYGAGESFSEAAEFDLRAGQTAVVSDITPGGISGRIESPRGEIGDVTVRVTDASSRQVASVLASNAGVFRIATLARGPYYLEVVPKSPSLFVRQWFDGADSIGAAEPIEIPEDGPIVSVAVRLVEGGKILGRVVDSWGDAANETSVGVIPAGRWWSWAATSQVLPDGSFALTGLPDGEYKLGTGQFWYPGTASRDSADVLVIRDHAELRGIVFICPSPARP